eukprot:373547_1
MNKLNVIHVSVPYDVINLILEFYCNKYLAYEYGFEWQKILVNARKNHKQKLSQQIAIQQDLSKYFEDDEECFHMTLEFLLFDSNNIEYASSNKDVFDGWDWSRAAGGNQSDQYVIRNNLYTNALERIFDEYIDPDQNYDVDVEEWILGLQTLNVQLNETQQRRMFNFMDKDGSG